ncbi:NADP oxidoreductase [Candidatus Bathyarchaeota archaeon]|nr:NADP oxidoreductase [Candidatus Bathyarchaeota archaeon]
MSSEKARLATMWFYGCSGCHMSFLDLDERLVDLAKVATLVHSPIVDIKHFPPDVALTLIEGAVANVEQVETLREVRKRTKLLVSLGDCAVTGNVTALRNAWEHGDRAVLERAYADPSNLNAQIPNLVPKLLDYARPLHEIVKIDHYIPGCPPNADQIYYVVGELLAGRQPVMEGRSKYG